MVIRLAMMRPPGAMPAAARTSGIFEKVPDLFFRANYWYVE